MLQQFEHHADHQRIRGMAKDRVLLQSAWTVQHHTDSKLPSQPVLNGVAWNLSARNDLAAFNTSHPPKSSDFEILNKKPEHTHHLCMSIWLWLGTLILWVSSLGLL
jgi:hypothetical protein